MTTSWRSRAGSPITSAGSGSTDTITPVPAATGPSVDAPDEATSPRSTGTRSRATAPESERASSNRSSTIAARWSTSSRMSVEGRADRRDRLVAMAFEVVDAGPDDRQGRAQLVRGVGRELALAPQGFALGDERAADGHERAAGVRRTGPGRDEEGHDAADDEDDEQDVERAHLGRPVADDLEVELVATREPGPRSGRGPGCRRWIVAFWMSRIPVGLDRLDPGQRGAARRAPRLTRSGQVDLLARGVGQQREACPTPARRR